MTRSEFSFCRLVGAVLLILGGSLANALPGWWSLIGGALAGFGMVALPDAQQVYGSNRRTTR